MKFPFLKPLFLQSARSPASMDSAAGSATHSAIHRLSRPSARRSIRWLAAGLAMLQLMIGAAGAVLDSSFAYTVPIGEGTTYTRLEGKNAAGKQRANILTYRPNSTVTPRIIYTGDSLYGSRSAIQDAATYAQQQSGQTVLGGVNADFFVLSSGVPIGLVIDEGELISSDAWQYAVGFRSDGSALIGHPTASMTITGASGRVVVSYFNKTRTTAGAYLLDHHYADNTHFARPGTSIILERLEDTPVTVNGTIRMKVVKTVTGSDPLTLAPNQMILTKSEGANIPTWVDFPDGEEVTFRSFPGEAAWNTVQYAVGGKLLMQNGNITTEGIDAASRVTARSAVGIKADGTVVLYEIDGLQSYSAGLTAAQLGEEMKAQGCVHALCLDGGGSSAMTVKQPGTTSTALVSSPSDGSPRPVANYIFLLSHAAADGKPAHLLLQPTYRYILPGAATTFTVQGLDAAYNPAPAPEGLTFTAEKGTVSEQLFTSDFTAGTATITATSSAEPAITGTTQVCVTPAVEVIQLQSNGTAVNSVSIRATESIDLDALAYRMDARMGAYDELFQWKVTGDIGKINARGVFTASEVAGSGSITCSYGGVSQTIPVSVGMGEPQPGKLVADFETEQPCTASDGVVLSYRTDYGAAARGQGALQALFLEPEPSDTTQPDPVSETEPSDTTQPELETEPEPSDTTQPEPETKPEPSDATQPDPVSETEPSDTTQPESKPETIADDSRIILPQTDVSAMHFISLWGKQLTETTDTPAATGHLECLFTDTEGNEVTAPLLPLLDQWQVLSVEIPAGAQFLTGLRLVRDAPEGDNSAASNGATGKGEVTVLLDHIMLTSHHAISDEGAPILSLAESALTVEAGTAATITGTATMEQGLYPVRTDNVTIKLDGVVLNGRSDAGANASTAGTPLVQRSGTTLTITTPPLDAGTHCVTVDVVDDAGSRARDSVTITAGADAAVFADTAAHWARGYASLLHTAGIMQGETANGQTYFRPNRNLKRVEFAIMMARLLGLDTTYSGELDFTDDADIPEWARGAVCAVLQAGIMNGKQNADGVSFSPQAEMSRAEVMTAIGRILPQGFEAAPLPYADAEAVPAWAAVPMQRCIAAGVVSGYPDNTVRPSGKITRGEIAKIFALL